MESAQSLWFDGRSHSERVIVATDDVAASLLDRTNRFFARFRYDHLYRRQRPASVLWCSYPSSLRTGHQHDAKKDRLALTSANSFTPPSLMPFTHRLSANSFIVIGLVASIFPVISQCFNRPRGSAFGFSFALSNGVKPRLGNARVIGVWPPSKRVGVAPSERAVRPFWPRPEVLPLPDELPRPTRVF